MAWDTNGNYLPNNDGTDPTSRLAMSIDSIMDLAEAYDNTGGFNIQIVTFSYNASSASTTFTDLNSLEAYLDTLRAGGGTEYDDAISEAMDTWSDIAADSSVTSGNSVAYFISDGEPNSGHGLDSSEQSAWESYVDQNFSVSYAIGIGNTGPSDHDLQTIAHTPGGYLGDVDDAIFTVANLDDLTSTLVATVNSTTTGNALINTEEGRLIGADDEGAPTLVSITYDLGDGTGEHTVTFDPADPDTMQTITLEHGAVLEINGQGEYSYTAGIVDSDYSVDFTYLVQDGDGSQDTGVATFTSLDMDAPGAISATDDAAYGLEGHFGEGDIPDVRIVPDDFGSQNHWEGEVSTESFVINGSASDAVTVTADVALKNFYDGDTITVRLVDDKGVTVAGSEQSFTVDGTYSFDMTQTGTYHLVVFGDDATGYKSLRATISDIELDGSAPTPWIPGIDPADGNVLDNDAASAALTVTEVAFGGIIYAVDSTNGATSTVPTVRCTLMRTAATPTRNIAAISASWTCMTTSPTPSATVRIRTRPTLRSS